MDKPLGPSWNTKDMAVEIIHELGVTLNKIGADSDVLALVGSFRDTLSDEEILNLLRDYNSTGSIFAQVVAEVEPIKVPQQP